MKAIVARGEGKAPDLRWESVEDPVPGPGEITVDVHATAVNRADLLQARGLYPPPEGASEILGLEFSGTVAEIGDAETEWAVDDRVCALTAGGGYAERAAIHPGLLLPLPEGWSFEEGAALPEVWLTAFSNLFMEGSLSAGETVLIHAGASGVGTAAIQLAVSAGARVAVTAGSDEKLARCRDLGAAVAVNYKTGNFAEEIREATEGGGVDLILDPVGGPYLSDNLDLLRPHGRLISIGLMGGRRAEIDLAQVLGKSLRILGTRLRARPLTQKVEIVRRFRERFMPKIRAGALKPVIDTVFPIQEAAEAHAHVRENRNVGKVILKVR